MVAQPNFDVCPMTLAQHDKVVKFADVDGAAFIFTKTSVEGKPVRADLDEIYADTDLSFKTARLESTVDLETVDIEYDTLFIYE